jgi:hypothetical protein
VTAALDLILGTVGGLCSAAYLWFWLRSTANLLWLAPIRPSLVTTTLLTLFAATCLIIEGGLSLGPWTAVATALIAVPIVGLAVVNVAAWEIARSRYARNADGLAVITWQANAARPLRGVPDLLPARAARRLRGWLWWSRLRRVVWAAGGYALQHRQAELFSEYERPPIQEPTGQL